MLQIFVKMLDGKSLITANKGDDRNKWQEINGVCEPSREANARNPSICQMEAGV